MRAKSVCKTRQLNNDGVSLIELLVALLILGILVIPLMGIFTRAAKTNTFNTKRADADIVAQNIMEATKVFGIEGTALEVKTCAEGGYVGSCLGMNPTGAYDTTTAGGSYTLGDNKFHKSATNIYSYELEGVKEGAHTYNVSIKFDSNYTITETPTGPVDPETTPVEKDVNTVDVYDLSAFNEKSTVFVNPLSGLVYYDEEALSTISEMNATMMEIKYDNDFAAAQDRNAAKQREYDQKILEGVSPSPTPPTYETMPDRTSETYRQRYPDEFYDKLHRTMVIDIAEENVSEGGTSKTVCKINSVLNYHIPVMAATVDGSAAPLVEGNDVSAVTISESGYCHDVTVDDIKTLYIMYTPYPYMCKSAFVEEFRSSLYQHQFVDAVKTQLETFYTDYMLKDKIDSNKISFLKENVVINNRTDKDLEVYLVIQGNRGFQFADNLDVEVNNTNGGSVEMYSQAGINGITSNEGIMKATERQHQDKLVTVTITVTDADDPDVTRTIVSTIQR
ncbi:MAG: prepilin-type N-terminal cleavage/methylation domain-containing protein [Lachnospiraceae bacterium]|nr:prepilin-type N-terminal cleavage/methylation domain-containing protein [Lachnospiraceae bacterium]